VSHQKDEVGQLAGQVEGVEMACNCHDSCIPPCGHSLWHPTPFMQPLRFKLHLACHSLGRNLTTCRCHP
jgi:hypothetical protein